MKNENLRGKENQKASTPTGDIIEVSNVAEGSAVAVGRGAQASVLNIPTEKFLIAELATSIAIQWVIYLCSLSVLKVGFIVLVWSCICFPLLFVPNAVYGLFMGLQLRNKKIILLSIFSALSALILWIIAFFFALPTLLSETQ